MDSQSGPTIPPQYPRLNKLELKLSEDPFIKVAAILGKQFLEYLKTFLSIHVYSYVIKSTPPPLWL